MGLLGVWNFEAPNVLIWGWNVEKVRLSGIWYFSVSQNLLSVLNLGSLKMLVWLFGGLRRLIDMSSPFSKVMESPLRFISRHIECSYFCCEYLFYTRGSTLSNSSAFEVVNLDCCRLMWRLSCFKHTTHTLSGAPTTVSAGPMFHRSRHSYKGHAISCFNDFILQYNNSAHFESVRFICVLHIVIICPSEARANLMVR